MPIKKHVTVSANSSWAIWEITESYDELSKMLALDHQDLHQLSRVNRDMKRKEYLAGRLAVKELLIRAGLPFHGIYKDEWGKPHLLDSSFHVSISNTFPFAVAMLDQNAPAGIDMEKANSKFLKIRHKFLNANELDYSGENILSLNILWCAKEALYKVFGKKSLSFRNDIAIDPFQTAASGRLNGQISFENFKQDHQLEYQQWGDYVICFSL